MNLWYDIRNKILNNGQTNFDQLVRHYLSFLQFTAALMVMVNINKTLGFVDICSDL